MRDKNFLIISLFITCCHLKDMLSGKQHYASAALTSFASFGSMVNSNSGIVLEGWSPKQNKKKVSKEVKKLNKCIT